MSFPMKKWKQFLILEEQKLSFYKSSPDKEFITEVLGIELPLNESHTEYSQLLVEEIIREQILFEGFWDTIKDKAKEYGQSITDLFKTLKEVVTSGRLFNKFMRQLKMYISNIKQNFMNFVQKVIDKVPSLQEVMTKIQSAVQKAFSIVEGVTGWKGVLALSGIIVVFSYIQDKFKDFIKDQTNVEENAKLLYQYIIEKLDLESVSRKILGSLTDIKSYLGILGPIVGGVKFVADALGSITRPFVEKYFETDALDMNV